MSAKTGFDCYLTSTKEVLSARLLILSSIDWLLRSGSLTNDCIVGIFTNGASCAASLDTTYSFELNDFNGAKTFGSSFTSLGSSFYFSGSFIAMELFLFITGISYSTVLIFCFSSSFSGCY